MGSSLDPLGSTLDKFATDRRTRSSTVGRLSRIKGIKEKRTTFERIWVVCQQKRPTIPSASPRPLFPHQRLFFWLLSVTLTEHVRDEWRVAWGTEGFRSLSHFNSSFVLHLWLLHFHSRGSCLRGHTRATLFSVGLGYDRFSSDADEIWISAGILGALTPSESLKWNIPPRFCRGPATTARWLRPSGTNLVTHSAG